MKKITKKLLISVMVLMAAVSLAATSTYAWFTMNDTPDVQGFDVNVTTVDGLYISLTPATGTDPAAATAGKLGTFKSYVTAAEVKTALLAYGNGANAVNSTTLKSLTHGTTTTGATFTQPAGVKAPLANETDHYTFRLYFRSNSKYAVKLNLTAPVTGGTEGNYTYGPVPSRVDSARGTQNFPYAKAWTNYAGDPLVVTPLSFLYNGVATEYAEGADLVAAAKDAVRIQFNDIAAEARNTWDPNAGKGFSSDAQADNVAFQYYNQINDDNLTYDVGPMTSSVNGSEVLLTLTGSDAAGYAGYLDIILWLEGWDANAFNSILGDIITTTLQFKGTVVA